jgi:hypothetical protein
LIAGLDQPAFAFDHLLDLADGHDRDQVALRTAGNVGHRVDRLATQFAQFLAPRRRHVEPDHLEAGSEQTPCEGGAHQTDANQTDDARHFRFLP